MRLHDHGETLAHVEHRHAERAGRRRRRAHDEERQRARCKPSTRPGTPRGAASQATPASATATAHSGGACCCHAAAGSAASAFERHHQRGEHRVRGLTSSASIGNTMPTSASGTTANVTTGIASALASGETSETCWKSASVPGTSATVTTASACAPRRAVRAARARRAMRGGGDVSRPTPA